MIENQKILAMRSLIGMIKEVNEAIIRCPLSLFSRKQLTNQLLISSTEVRTDVATKHPIRQALMARSLNTDLQQPFI